MKELSIYQKQIESLCALYNVRTLFAFGSVTTGLFRIDSDIDLIVDIDSQDPLVYSDNYFNLKFQLENLLHRHIDLLEQKSIQNPYLRQQIDQTKVLVYGK